MLDANAGAAESPAGAVSPLRRSSLDSDAHGATHWRSAASTASMSPDPLPPAPMRPPPPPAALPPAEPCGFALPPLLGLARTGSSEAERELQSARQELLALAAAELDTEGRGSPNTLIREALRSVGREVPTVEAGCPDLPPVAACAEARGSSSHHPPAASSPAPPSPRPQPRTSDQAIAAEAAASATSSCSSSKGDEEASAWAQREPSCGRESGDVSLAPSPIPPATLHRSDSTGFVDRLRNDVHAGAHAGAVEPTTSPAPPTREEGEEARAAKPRARRRRGAREAKPAAPAAAATAAGTVGQLASSDKARSGAAKRTGRLQRAVSNGEVASPARAALRRRSFSSDAMSAMWEGVTSAGSPKPGPDGGGGRPSRPRVFR